MLTIPLDAGLATLPSGDPPTLHAIVERACQASDEAETAAAVEALRQQLAQFPLDGSGSSGVSAAEERVEAAGTALMLAAAEGRADCLDCILEAGTATHQASALANFQGRTDPNLTNRGVVAAMDRWINGTASPLYVAAQAGHATCVSLLLVCGADPNFAHTLDASTPLYACCEGGHVDVVARLLAAGASPDQPREEGTTPLMACCVCALRITPKRVARPESPFELNALPISSVFPPSPAPSLPARPPSLRAAQPHYCTRLAALRSHGFHQCATMLLAAGANVDAEDDFGRTPLSHAFAYAQGRLREPASWRREACLSLIAPSAAATQVPSAVRVAELQYQREQVTQRP